ncbi:hypothetical protein [Frondihabitans australicus]|uniref:Uncharacterized protein n=1 Tax=Frondihabitans australicus TaxID=386892 RepID=A0A495IFF3_9MICO|nr:hypothetical protein [Frondihabitans australicus]RKR74752.1 hypothetical protein C8E83_1881 [Frondihabitans australicus]
MPKFNENNRMYTNVNEIAAREGLIWDGQFSNPYGIAGLISKDLQDEEMLRDGDLYSRLFDHTKRFRPRGRGARQPVLAILSPYADAKEIRPLAAEFALRFGLEHRLGDARDRIYVETLTVPILFWRADLHDFVG